MSGRGSDLALRIDDFRGTAAFLPTIANRRAQGTGIGSLCVSEVCDGHWGVGVATSPWYPGLALERQPCQEFGPSPKRRDI